MYTEWVSFELRKDKIRELGILHIGKSNWIEYREKFDSFRNFIWRGKEDGKDFLLKSIGSKSTKLLRKLIKPQTIENCDLISILEAFETHFYPEKNEAYYIAKFTVRKQRRFESFFRYVVVLRNLMTNCKYGKRKHSKLRNQIVSGANDSLKELFLQNISLSKIFEIGLLFDSVRSMNSYNSSTAKKKKRMADFCYRCSQSLRGKHANITCPFDWAICSSCQVKGHVCLACKYIDVTCHRCNGVGHIAKLCKKPTEPVNQEPALKTKAS